MKRLEYGVNHSYFTGAVTNMFTADKIQPLKSNVNSLMDLSFPSDETSKDFCVINVNISDVKAKNIYHSHVIFLSISSTYITYFQIFLFNSVFYALICTY